MVLCINLYILVHPYAVTYLPLSNMVMALCIKRMLGNEGTMMYIFQYVFCFLHPAAEPGTEKRRTVDEIIVITTFTNYNVIQSV
jgi:hypothetical protein